MDDIFVMKILKPIEELANHSPELMFLIVMDFDFSFFKDLDKKGNTEWRSPFWAYCITM